MAIGAYSVVRFGDSMRDERVNLGVVVWHPTQGFSCRLPKALDRAKAVNPSLDAKEIRRQMQFLTAELKSNGVDGLTKLRNLSKVLHEGLQVSTPYPTRLSGANECADHLFQLLVHQGEGAAKRPTAGFELARNLREVAFRISPAAIVEELGERHIANVRVNLGVRTSVRGANFVWRWVALNTRPEDQVARAKATVMDILKVRSLPEFDQYKQAVAVQCPSSQGEAFSEAKQWLTEQTKNVVTFSTSEELSSEVEKVLKHAA